MPAIPSCCAGPRGRGLPTIPGRRTGSFGASARPDDCRDHACRIHQRAVHGRTLRGAARASAVEIRAGPAGVGRRRESSPYHAKLADGASGATAKLRRASRRRSRRAAEAGSSCAPSCEPATPLAVPGLQRALAPLAHTRGHRARAHRCGRNHCGCMANDEARRTVHGEGCPPTASGLPSPRACRCRSPSPARPVMRWVSGSADLPALDRLELSGAGACAFPRRCSRRSPAKGRASPDGAFSGEQPSMSDPTMSPDRPDSPATPSRQPVDDSHGGLHLAQRPFDRDDCGPGRPARPLVARGECRRVPVAIHFPAPSRRARRAAVDMPPLRPCGAPTSRRPRDRR